MSKSLLPLIILDHEGARWYVAEGDPSAESCKELTSAGYRSIVLPRSAIVRDIYPSPHDLDVPLLRLQKAWKSTGDEDLREEYVRLVRMRDCLITLEEAKDRIFKEIAEMEPVIQ